MNIYIFLESCHFCYFGFWGFGVWVFWVFWKNNIWDFYFWVFVTWEFRGFILVFCISGWKLSFWCFHISEWCFQHLVFWGLIRGFVLVFLKKFEKILKSKKSAFSFFFHCIFWKLRLKKSVFKNRVSTLGAIFL